MAEGRIIQPGVRGLDIHVLQELHGYRYDIFKVRTAERRTMRACRSVRSTESDWHIVDTLNGHLLLRRPFAYKKYSLSLRNFQHLYELVQPVVVITDTAITTETVKYYFTVTLLLQIFRLNIVIEF